jgi:hypothetical protein
LVAFLYGEQLRDFHVSASARSPSRRFSHFFPERLLLVFPSAAVAEEMFPRLGRVSLFFWACGFLCFCMDGHPQVMAVLFPC